MKYILLFVLLISITSCKQSKSSDKKNAIIKTEQQISFVTDRDGNSEIYLMGVDGKQLKNITNHSAPDYYPEWSS
ncbi:MAG: translocation protein TolB, partial [Croceitalea sp.]|nr:translocation protein TolB [Croceitalea sp.]